MNPARSFGPAAVTKFETNHWVRTFKMIPYLDLISNFKKSACMPARNFTSLIFQVYWVGPILGGMCAGMVYQMLFKVSKPEPYTSVATSEEKEEI